MINRLLHVASAGSAVSGLMVLAASCIGTVAGNVSAQGSSIAETVSLKPASIVVADAGTAGMQLIIGMLLVLLGLTFYALVVTFREKAALEAKMPRAWTPKWFWMHMRLR